MKKSVISFSVLLLFAFILLANSVNDYESLPGSWIFTVSGVPAEYSRGKVVFERDSEQGLVGKILFATGMEVKISKITQEKEKITLEVYVDGVPVKTLVTVNDHEMKGFVQTDEGNMPFSAKRELPEN